MRTESSPERKLERPVDWSKVTVLAAKTNEDVNADHPRLLQPRELDLLLSLREMLQSMPKPPEHLSHWIDLTIAQDRPEWSPDVLSNVAYALSSQVTVGEVNYKKPNGMELIDDANLRLTRRSLEQVPKRDILTFADSHTATAYTLLAAEQSGWDLQHTAVLSFDRHTDYRPEAEHAVLKPTVMSDILKRTQVPAVAVVGPFYHSNKMQPRTDGKYFDLLTGDSIMAGNKANESAYQQWMTGLFQTWQADGITAIYTTVDLDGLRLYTQGYTGTDYSPSSILIKALKNGTLESIVSQYNGHNVTELVRRLRFEADTRELNGIPASWIGRALDQAKQLGFQIGVKHPDKPKRLIGDVVEYMVPDAGGRTAKIAQALMRRLASVAQQS